VTERADQRALFQHTELHGVPGAVFWHTPNGGYRSPVEAKIFKGLGVKAGMPDVLALHRAQLYALELKHGRGRLSPAQVQMLRVLEAAGAITGVARGLDDALAWLTSHGLLRGVVQ
jgi:hypothetical protein